MKNHLARSHAFVISGTQTLQDMTIRHLLDPFEKVKDGGTLAIALCDQCIQALGSPVLVNASAW
jgi:hypothetical protein